MHKDIAIFMMENEFLNEVTLLTDSHIRCLVESLTAMAKYGNYSAFSYEINPDALTDICGGSVNISVMKKTHVGKYVWDCVKLTMWFNSSISKSTYQIRDCTELDYVIQEKWLEKDFMDIEEQE